MLHRQEPAEVREIDLDDVGDAGFDELAMSAMVCALAGRNRQARGGADAASAAAFSGGTGSSITPGRRARAPPRPAPRWRR
jgi:hypothetical protein